MNEYSLDLFYSTKRIFNSFYYELDRIQQHPQVSTPSNWLL